MDTFTWNEERRRWCGHAEVASRLLETAVEGGAEDADGALEAARKLLAVLSGRVDAARAYAAGQLQPYYNYFNAHLQDGEQLDEAEFAARLELEGVYFLIGGDALLEYSHTLYRGSTLNEGGMVAVRVGTDGEFQHASWMTGPDAETARQIRRCCEAYPWPDEYEG